MCELVDETRYMVLARDAYDAYCRMVGYRSVHDEALPLWSNLPIRIQRAWVEAARAVAVRAINEDRQIIIESEEK